MADVFDDVDKILSDVSLTEADEKSFNEAELRDIMSEIEDLEKEFDEAAPSDKSTIELKFDVPPVISKKKVETLQEKIDRELAESVSDVDSKETSAPPAQKSELLSFEKSLPTGKNDVAFEARGSMSMNLDFMIGSESAKLCIDPSMGLTVTFSDVVLCISESEGCVFTMENGMKFTIPLSSVGKHLKKKTA